MIQQYGWCIEIAESFNVLVKSSVSVVRGSACCLHATVSAVTLVQRVSGNQ